MVENLLSGCFVKDLLRFMTARLPNCARAVGDSRDRSIRPDVFRFLAGKKRFIRDPG
jgi:hypothetical protein